MLTKAQKQDYLTSGGYLCPYCGSDNLSADSWDGEGKYQPVTCQSCGKEWRDVYELVGIEEVEEDQSDVQLPEKIATDGSIAK